MIGTSDEIGRTAITYLARYGDHADCRLSDDLSRAIGQKRREEARRLNRVKLRLMRLEQLGLLDGPHPAWQRCAAAAQVRGSTGA